jgi:hypothetical protein
MPTWLEWYVRFSDLDVLRPDYAALMCTFPLLVSFYPADSKTGQNLPSLLSTVYCLGQLVFLGIAQRQVGQVSFISLMVITEDKLTA